jgi:hypothetical protein
MKLFELKLFEPFLNRSAFDMRHSMLNPNPIASLIV